MTGAASTTTAAWTAAVAAALTFWPACASKPQTGPTAPAESAASSQTPPPDPQFSISPFKVTAKLSVTFPDKSFAVTTSYRGDANGVVEYQVEGRNSETVYRAGAGGVFDFYRKGKPVRQFKMEASGNLSLLPEWEQMFKSIAVKTDGSGYINGRAAFRIENGQVVDVGGGLLQFTASDIAFSMTIPFEGDDSARQLAGVVIALLLASSHVDFKQSDWP